MARLDLKPHMWPEALYGVVELHNGTCDVETKMSPHMKVYGVAPSLNITIGELVVWKPPKAVKTLAFPGRTGMYLGKHNAQNAIVLDENRKVHHVHPAALKLKHQGSMKGWIDNYYATKEERKNHSCARNEQPASPRQQQSKTRNTNTPLRATSLLLDLAPQFSSDSDSDDSSDYVPLTRARAVDRVEAEAAAAVAVIGAEGVDEVFANNQVGEHDSIDFGDAVERESVSDVAEVESANERRSSQVNSPRMTDDRQYVLMAGADNLLCPAKIIKSRSATTDVAWLEEKDGVWEPSSFGYYIPNSKIHSYFALINSQIPDHLVSELGKEWVADNRRTEGHALFTCAVARPKGGVMERPAQSQEMVEGLYDAAMLREFVTILQNDVFGSEVRGCPNAMKTKWVLTRKENEMNGTVRHKARLVAQGFSNPNVGEVHVATPATPMMLLALLYIISMNMCKKMVDIKAAFLHAPVPENDGKTVVQFMGSVPQLPPCSPFPDISEQEYQILKERASKIKPGCQYMLNKALYGWKKAPFRWEATLGEGLRDLGFVPVEEGIWIARDECGAIRSVVIVHSDDIFIGDRVGEETEKKLAAKFSCNPPEVLTEGKSLKYLGMELREEKNTLSLSLAHYLEDVPVSVKKLRQIKEVDLLPGEDSEVKKELIPEYRALVGKFAWAAKLDADCDTWLSAFSQLSLKPTEKHLTFIRTALAALKQCSRPLLLKGVSQPLLLVGYSDAAYSLRSRTTRVGYKVYVGEGQEVTDESALVAWKSRRVARLLDSSTSAELLALKLVVKHMFSLKSLVEILWNTNVRVEFRIDSLPLYNQIRTGKVAEERAMQPDLDYTMQEMRVLKSRVRWVRREFQKADSMTRLVWFHA
eukprot:GHVU01212710.1.p1 GENE.GHVU01212710.1~~GHVU01212710.1.p1  ORF type:complete len:872 (-),score=107.79 GHVU01212710.1:114-2729(-)